MFLTFNIRTIGRIIRGGRIDYESLTKARQGRITGPDIRTIGRTIKVRLLQRTDDVMRAYRIAVTAVSSVVLAGWGFWAGYLSGYVRGSEHGVLVSHRLQHVDMPVGTVAKVQVARTGTILVNDAPEHWTVMPAVVEK